VLAANLPRVGVLSSNGVVYLSGTVAAPESRQKAETPAGGVRGVRRVVNMLVIGPEP
jgi:osmotically-inducible protein OsmY